MSTPERTEANRLNAQLSTGPTTEGGKSRSKANALKMGLSGRGLILPENEAKLADLRMTKIDEALGLTEPDAFAELLVRQIAVESVRIERCQQEELLIREQCSAESLFLWDHARRIEVCELSQTFHKQPELVRLKLESSAQGVAWLQGRWRMLQTALVDKMDWNDAEIALADDLAGTPILFRDTERPKTFGERQALVDQEIRRLATLVEDRRVLDENAKQYALAGVSPDIEKRVKTIRRYESASRRAFEKSLAELRRYQGLVTRKDLLAEIVAEPVPIVETPKNETKPTLTEEELPTLVRLGEIITKVYEREIQANPDLFKELSAEPTKTRPASPLNRQERRKRLALKRSA